MCLRDSDCVAVMSVWLCDCECACDCACACVCACVCDCACVCVDSTRWLGLACVAMLRVSLVTVIMFCPLPTAHCSLSTATARCPLPTSQALLEARSRSVPGGKPSTLGVLVAILSVTRETVVIDCKIAIVTKCLSELTSGTCYAMCYLV